MPSSEPTAEQLALVLEIDRVFSAPRALVWQLWRDPEHIIRWHGPEGCTLSFCAQDFRPGGKWRRVMSAGQGHAHVIFGEFIDVDEPARLIFTYINESDGFETVVSMDFIELPDGMTRMLFRQTPFVSKAERDGHGRGWSSSFDLLSKYLALFMDEDWAPKGMPRRGGVADDFIAAKARQDQQTDEQRQSGSRGSNR